MDESTLVKTHQTGSATEERNLTVLVRIRERLHLRLSDHKAYFLLIAPGVWAYPCCGRVWHGHGGFEFGEKKLTISL